MSCPAPGNHRLGARENGGLQGAAHRRVRRRAAAHGYRQDPLAQAPGRGVPKMKLWMAALLVVSLPALGQVEISDAWIRATAPGQKTAAGYMTIRNTSAQPERLAGGSSEAAAKVGTHVSTKDGEIMRMREVK